MARMTLQAVTKSSNKDLPLRILVYGVEGVGKSTLGAAMPSPVFLGPEDGAHHLNVSQFPEPKNWSEVREALVTLAMEKHDYKTIVVDTVDWIEPLLWTHICQASGQQNIEDFGYGRGYVKALDGWREAVSLLERVRAKGINVALLGHSIAKTWKNPEGDDYQRYTLKIHEKAAGLLKEWCDLVLFANHETYAVKDPQTQRVRGLSSGARVLYTERNAAYDAKNRFSLPAKLPLDWEELQRAIKAGAPASVAEMLATIEDKLKGMDPEYVAQVRGYVEKNRSADALAKVVNKLNAKKGSAA